jgi:hypothetical protein
VLASGQTVKDDQISKEKYGPRWNRLGIEKFETSQKTNRHKEYMQVDHKSLSLQSIPVAME